MIKKTAFTIAAIATVFLAQSQRNNLLMVDLHSPIGRTGSITFQHVLSSTSTIGLNALYTEDSEIFNSSGYLSRFALSPEYRFYLQEHPAPRGFYMMFLLRTQFMNTLEEIYVPDSTGWNPTFNFEERKLNTMGGGVALGLQEVFKDRISIDLFLGTVFNSGEKRDNPETTEDEGNDFFEPYVGYFLTSGVRIGVVF